jgi:hypothetical protein
MHLSRIRFSRLGRHDIILHRQLDISTRNNNRCAKVQPPPSLTIHQHHNQTKPQSPPNGQQWLPQMYTLSQPQLTTTTTTTLTNITLALHPLRPHNLRLGRPPIPPPPLCPAPHRLPLQLRHPPHHRPRILPLPHPRPHSSRPRRLKPHLYRRDPHRSPSRALNNLHLLAQHQRTRQQWRRLRLTAPPRWRRGDQRAGQSYRHDRRGLPGCYGFLPVHAAHGRMEFCFHGGAGWQRGAVLFWHVDTAVWWGRGPREQDDRRG